MKAFGGFVLAAAGLIGASMGALMLLFPSAADHEALELTAVVAFAVHVAAFAAARMLRRGNLWVAWGVGSVLRLGALVVYAALVVKVLALPPAPALIGCATFLFLPTLIEPLLLLK
ncbi:MAG: hypothetical protein KGL93_07905 [Gemmatimonadota bacterium]|nr:hypothetical protein [Gemmatimonadota bacterium]HEU4990847.1 hypothetical protein [Gemmatimonadaceae bacterium]